jgi:hypothetical protein
MMNRSVSPYNLPSNPFSTKPYHPRLSKVIPNDQTMSRFNPYEENGGSILAIAGQDFSVIAGDTRCVVMMPFSIGSSCPDCLDPSSQTVSGLQHSDTICAEGVPVVSFTDHCLPHHSHLVRSSLPLTGRRALYLPSTDSQQMERTLSSGSSSDWR